MALIQEKKGQAALSDALYFLMIVSVLCTILFFYAANYGLTVQDRIVKQFWREYATSSLETILYSSTPRLPGLSLEESPEVDYLLAAVKEDYADDSEIDETKEVLAQNISGIMQPLSGSFDYLFYIYLPDDKKFVFTLIYTREAPIITETEIIHGTAGTYFCKPATLNELQELVEGVGSSAQSDARIQLVELDQKGNASYPAARANLTIWVPTPIEEKLAEMNCVLFEEFS